MKRLVVSLTPGELRRAGITLPLPPAAPACSACQHGYSGSDGVFCRVFNEVINNEAIAASCSEFQN